MRDTGGLLRGDRSLPIPVAIDDIDPAWLTAALQSASCNSEPAVRVVFRRDDRDWRRPVGLLYRLTVDYRGDRRLDAADGDRQAAGTHRRDAPSGPRRTASTRRKSRSTATSPRKRRCERRDVYFADHDLDTDDFVLVMEDLGHLRAADQIAGCDREDALAAIAALARHHAAFWNDARFASDELAWLPFGSDHRFPKASCRASRRYWEPFVEFIGDDLEPRDQGGRRLASGRGARAVERSRRTRHHRRRTATTGSTTCSSTTARAVTALDWQITTKAVGGYDFAYFVTQSLSAADRRQHLDELVETYLSTLADAGRQLPRSTLLARRSPHRAVLPRVPGASDGPRSHRPTCGGARSRAHSALVERHHRNGRAELAPDVSRSVPSRPSRHTLGCGVTSTPQTRLRGAT